MAQVHDHLMQSRFSLTVGPFIDIIRHVMLRRRSIRNGGVSSGSRKLEYPRDTLLWYVCHAA